ncbi:WD40 repeat domain-containing protein [Streptomyces sp. NPDC058171]
MNTEGLLKETLHAQATVVAPAPADLADRVLAARRRGNRLRGAVAVAAVIALGLTGSQVLPGDTAATTPAADWSNDDVLARPDQSPPRDLIAAGDLAIGAYYTVATSEKANDTTVYDRTYRLLNRSSGRYEKSAWSYVDVAPGLRTAAVLVGDLPTRRIGLVDLDSGYVDRWITVRKAVAAVAFSPDGTRLVGTTYRANPDIGPLGKDAGSSDRTGFSVIDVASGEEKWRPTKGVNLAEVAFGARAGESQRRQDFDWTADGKRVHVPNPTPGYVSPDVVYTGPWGAGVRNLDGKPVRTSEPKMTEGRLLGGGVELPMVDAKESKPGEKPVAWPGGDRAIVWRCVPKSCKGEGATGRLTLVDTRTGRSLPLSGARPEVGAGRWEPVFAPR